MHTGEFALPTPTGLPALAPSEALSHIPAPPSIPAPTLGDAFSDAIKEVAHEIKAYSPSGNDEVGIRIDRPGVARTESYGSSFIMDTKPVLRIAAQLAKDLLKRGARLLK